VSTKRVAVTVRLPQIVAERISEYTGAALEA
jgi:hypothetical protein